jgi:molecular chaperone GrpE
MSAEDHNSIIEEVGAKAPAEAPSSDASNASSGHFAADSADNGPLDEEALAQDAATEAPDEPDEPEEPDWKDLALRKAAELENVRKQNAQRVQKASRDGMKRVASELLPALDDFERALAHAEAEEGDEQHTLTKGIRLVQAQLLAALRRAGIESFSPLGEPFDPHRHEAVATTPVDGTDSGTVVEVYQAGYRLGEEILRAAKVVVAG